MTATLRVSACAAILFGAVLFVGYVLVPWVGGPSLFPNDLNHLCQQLLDEQYRRDDLRQRNHAVIEVLECKREVTADVIAGRSSLAEAVQEFRRLQSRLEDGQEPLRGYHSTDSDELIARNVLVWVRATTRNNPQYRELLKRLEAELTTMCLVAAPGA